jgi:hypothetical protein
MDDDFHGCPVAAIYASIADWMDDCADVTPEDMPGPDAIRALAAVVRTKQAPRMHS